ncbi:sensor histidine kinase [Streptomyces sp. NPDC057702]|uniref:sensor histidine kinase n=1 Tax=unclassified Streptomyces TaxID=2593676 RepID=UPI003694A317
MPKTAHRERPRPLRPAPAGAGAAPTATDRRVRPAAASALAWAGALVYPLILFIAAQESANRSLAQPTGLALVLVATVLPGTLLRRWPAAALTLMLVGALAALTPPEISWALVYLLLLVDNATLAYVVAVCSRRTSLPLAALTLLTQVTVVLTGPPANGDTPNAAILCVVAALAAWTSGRALRERRGHAAVLRDQAAARAVTAERLRIAREVHDMVAHSIGVIAIQAGVGGRVIDTQPAEARRALSVIEATSRETLAGLRRTLVALRRGEPAPDGLAGPREPAPGLADLERLAATTAAAGVRVEVCRRGAAGPLPGDIDLAAYRIVQEALTNVIRHARTDTCQVTVMHREGAVTVEVTDAGRGGEVRPGDGLGIVGMRERAGLLGGWCTAGPRPGGGFRVTAELPIPAEAATVRTTVAEEAR